MTSKKTFTLEELAALTDCRLAGNPSQIITGVADLEAATPQDASFFSNPRYQQAMKKSNAGAIFVDASTPLGEEKITSFQHSLPGPFNNL